ncbi:MAG: hypothetical protein AAF939_19320 [Planctomycetota bacterium]
MISRIFAAIAITACLLAVSPAQAQVGYGNSANNLFSQYTTSNGNVTAGMYPAPHPAPYLGAHTYYTYQPLMPHEMMYPHVRNYYNYTQGGYYGATTALNKTSVRWYSGANFMGNLPFSRGANLGCKINTRRYCIGDQCNGGVTIGDAGCETGGCGN